MLSSDLGRRFTSHGYNGRNIDLIDNSPEEIREVVAEMLDRSDGSVFYSKQDEELHKSVTALYQKHSGYGDLGRMGKPFVKTYAHQGLL